jgi:DNA-binding CsgD family transcriptional regulator
MLPGTAAARPALRSHRPKSLPLSALYSPEPREGEVLGWMVEGKVDAEIGVILGLSTRTVEKHVPPILEQIGVETRTGAVTWCHERRRVERAIVPSAS